MHFKEYRNIRGAAERDRALEGRKISERFGLIEFLQRAAFSYTRVSAHDGSAKATCVPSELWTAEHPLSLSLPRSHTLTFTQYNGNGPRPLPPWLGRAA